MQLFLKKISGMENSKDTDQTVWSESALFAYAILSDTLVYKIVGYLPYLQVPQEVLVSTHNIRRFIFF